MPTVDKLSILALTAAVLTFGCSCQSDDPPPAAPTAPAAAPDPAQPRILTTEITGKIVESMESGGYLYALIDTGSEKAWVATRPVPAEVGDSVTIVNALEQIDFHAPSLDRTFDRIYFADSIFPGEEAPSVHGGETPSFHGETTPASEPELPATGVDRAEGGVTVEEVFQRKDELVDTEILIRGQVVKYNAQILGVNWLHVQDGTGEPGTNDLTITTSATGAVGDVVLVRGTLVADKDFGAGYKYDLIVENAEVTVE